ncbi:MAG: hypothetical protein CM1200mP36_09110 [Gammaproteobacteria bacterium]|nr:MAG: hypothetical protein CM1200mP36_09110 [Gammaproteobacteria bacterium]
MTFRLALTLATTSLFAQSCNAQAPGPEVGATIEATALALGTIRGIGRRMDSINTLQFSGRGRQCPHGRGEWMSYEISEAHGRSQLFLSRRRLDMIAPGLMASRNESSMSFVVIVPGTRGCRGSIPRMPLPERSPSA